MRRAAGWLFVVAALPIAEIHLSHGERRPAAPPPVPLWAGLQPPGTSVSAIVTRGFLGLDVTYPSPWSNCSIVVSLDPNTQYRLTTLDDGVRFDIDGDRRPNQVAWTERGSDVAFLAMDRDGDGRITSGKELVGDRTMPLVTNGFEVLSHLALAEGAPAVLDRHSPLFKQLLLWRDANHDGRTSAGELTRAADELADIPLGYDRHPRRDNHGNQSRFRGVAHVPAPEGHEILASPNSEQPYRRSIYEVCLTTGRT
jgi:hypothetical protein